MRCLLAGEASGPLLVLSAPLSFWGGVDTVSGEIIDRNHPEAGLHVTGAILALPYGRGSSSSATVLAEMIRIGSAPAGLVLDKPDQILVTGGYVANVLYGTRFIVSTGVLPDHRDGMFLLDQKGLASMGNARD